MRWCWWRRACSACCCSGPTPNVRDWRQGRKRRRRSSRELMARYRLHCIGASGNSYKLALYMNCAGLDWEPVGVDFAGGQTRDPDWRAGINAMGEVPVLEVDGQLMSQSGAILIWLAETTGHFAPAADQRYDALRWIMFDNHKFTNNHAMHRFQRSFMPSRCIRRFWRSSARAPNRALR